MRSAWTRSPQEVDPLSWFAGPWLPVVLAVVAVFQALIITILYWGQWSSVLLQFVAMPFFLVAGWLTGRSTQPHRAKFGPYTATIILLIAVAGLLVSAGGTVDSTMPIEQWWPGISLGVTLAAFAPYSSARQMIFYSVPTVVVVAVVGSVMFSSINHFWPPLGIVVISTGPVLVAALASVVFSYTVVSRTLALLETSAGDEEVYPIGVELSEAERTGGIARVSARVAPFLEGIVSAGAITEQDRALAAQIARGLRSDLVTATSRSWLEAITRESGVVVSDPGRLADGMNEAQRTALRALIVAATGSSVVDRQTVLVELRSQSDGSTAVALSIDVDLPEGRRMMLLAPYYLTLQTTVDDLSWAEGRSLMVKFRIPPSARD